MIRRMFCRAATFGGVALFLLMSGCGSEGHRVTRAQAAAFANEVNLRHVLSMSSEGGHEPNGQVVRFEVTPSHRCGPSDRGERFDFYSPIFRQSGGGHHAHAGPPVPLPAEGLHSKISVMESAGEQERDFSALGCDARSEAKKPNAQRLPSPLSGVRVLGLRTWRSAPSDIFGRTNAVLYSDGFHFVVGAAEVKLAVSSAPHPPDAGREHYLLSLLYNRAMYYAPLLAGKKVAPKPESVLIIR
jgi:hypothetical protein